MSDEKPPVSYERHKRLRLEHGRVVAQRDAMLRTLGLTCSMLRSEPSTELGLEIHRKITKTIAWCRNVETKP